MYISNAGENREYCPVQAQHGSSNDDADMISTAGNFLIATLSKQETEQQIVETFNWGIFATVAVSAAIVWAGYYFRRR